MRARVILALFAAAAFAGAPCSAKTYDNGRILAWQKPAPARAKPLVAKPKSVALSVAPQPLPITPPRIDPAVPLRQPSYPDASKRFEEQGNVTVGVLVQPDGHVARSWVEETSGFHRLDDAAVKTARGWQFIPALQGDLPVAASKKVVVRFAFED